MAKAKSAYSIPGKLGKLGTHIIVVWVGWLAKPKKYYFGLDCPSGQTGAILLWS